MAVATTRRRSSVRVQEPGVRFAVQDGDQPTFLVGTNTERQTGAAAVVHQRSDRSGPGRQSDHDSATCGSSVRRR